MGARRSAALLDLRGVREAVVWQSVQCPERRYGTVGAIGFRASDAVMMAGLGDLVARRGGRASAAAPMAGDCE